MRSGEIAKGTRTHRVEVYRILKSLQNKGIIEATLESPTRYTAVQLEVIIDSFIKAKREETAAMESTRQSVLHEWNKINKVESQPYLEKFVVIKGGKKIYSKILQMVKETRRTLSAAISISDMARADQLGILDAAICHPLKNKVELRFLTEVSVEKVRVARAFFERMPKQEIEFKARNPSLGLELSPRMVLRDGKELLFFIRPAAETSSAEDVCLWTNCNALISSFTAVFEDLWTNSISLKNRVSEDEVDMQNPSAPVLEDARTALGTFGEVMKLATKEIIIMTSSEGLIESLRNAALLKELSARDVSVKIMAPITKDNLQVAQELSQFCSIRHTRSGSVESTLVDGKHLVQSKEQVSHDGKRERIPYFGTFYSNDIDYVKKTKDMLDETWKKALVVSTSTFDSMFKVNPTAMPRLEREQIRPRMDSPHRKFILDVKSKRKVILEKEVLDKVIRGKKYSAKNWPRDIVRYYGSNGLAVIHPPVSFNLPDMTIWANYSNKQSSFGAADSLVVFLWLETPRGNAYVPVAFVSDNNGLVEFHKTIAAGMPSEHNAHLVRKSEIQIRVHGNTLFAGWTIPIQLHPASFILPPACITFEGYGPLTATTTEFNYPSGVKFVAEANGFDAFVTFFHPTSKYCGPGIDGRVHRDLVTSIYPPKQFHSK